MNRTVFLLSLLFILFQSCSKNENGGPIEPAHPVMIYKDLANKEIKYQSPASLDIDNDGSADFNFGVLLVGDPVLERDRLQFYVYSKQKRNLLNDQNDESPMLNKYELIKKIHPGYTWYEISAIVLAEKITNYNGSTWNGLWKNANHKYLPLQADKNGQVFHGWIELSFDTNTEKITLHKSAISTEPDKEVKAGY